MSLSSSNQESSRPRAILDGQPCDLDVAVDLLRRELCRALIGKEDVIELVLACVLARGHLLFDDLPGLGKTTLAKVVARAVGGHFARVQCTPDLLPTDITGFNMFDQKTREFEFRRGPVFSDVLLADEINRATPRTQSALFEAMAERQVTIDNHTYPLRQTFFVIATQNPVESHGAYPLPDAQLDRFAMKLRIGYPDRDSELAMLAANEGVTEGVQVESKSFLSQAQLCYLQEQVAKVALCDKVRHYLVDLGWATRDHKEIALGLVPRGLITWQRIAQARAYLHGRDFVSPDDIQEVAGPVLEVRLSSRVEETSQFLHEILSAVPVPTF
ncbi:MAG: MoxR family ATPase [Pirellulaceae bacterium]|nr:MoxR family ATPase [Planctomycetales bacterium]